ncbi:uncharacterized protein [Panulirus ornatus]|uniref:uncharacterized protein isoform X2 n=1 Tax=Panulirus ornatus TaxID=150431 RepID=UPI003A8B8A1F
MEVDGFPTSDLSERELERGTFDEPDGGDDPGEEEDGESDEDEMNEDDALDESDESDEELDTGNEEGNLDEDTEEKVSNEEKNVNEDAKEEESGDDKSEEARGKDVKVSTSGVMSVQPSEQKKQNRHIVFDEKDSNDLPLPEFLESSKLEDGEPEDSDSDAAPEEVTLAVGKKLADREDVNRKKELQKKKHLVKEDRKRKHVRNKLQQEQKRERLENLNSKRLPKNFLEAVVAEQKKQPGKKAIKKLRKKKKVKKFTDKCNTADVNVEEGLTTSQCGVHVQTLKQETEKNIFIAKQAEAFIKEVQYGKRVMRIESKELHQMEVRRQKSGKNILVKKL